MRLGAPIDVQAPLDRGADSAPKELHQRVSMQESGNKDYTPSGAPITSKKGAMYGMQVLPSTAKSPGMGVTPAQSNTPSEFNRVGHDYLDKLYSRFEGDENKALAAYNAGPKRVEDAIAKHGKNWLSHLPPETQDYVKGKGENKQTPPQSPKGKESGPRLGEAIKVDLPKGVVGDKEDIAKTHAEAQYIAHAKDLYEGLKRFLFQGEERQFSPEEAIKKGTGGALVGSSVGVIGPQTLETVGKVASKVPGLTQVGETMQLAGEAWKRTPMLSRLMGGAGGGFVSGTSGEYLESQGFSPAQVGAMQVVASGGAQSVASFTGDKLQTFAKLLGSGALNSKFGVVHSAIDLAKPNKEQFLREANAVQEEMFGKKIPGSFNGVIGTEVRNATRQQLFKDLVKEGYVVPPDVKGPASAFLRENVIEPAVKQASRRGDLFSNTPQGKGLITSLRNMEGRGFISKAQMDDAISDINRNDYQFMDRVIRDFGKSYETGVKPMAGVRAIDTQEQREFREKAKAAYNTYLERIGIGRADQLYRDTYKKELVAEMQDRVSHTLHYGASAGVTEGMTKNLSGMDTLVKLSKSGEVPRESILDGVKKYLANEEPDNVLKSFTRLDKLLVGSGVLKKEEMSGFQRQAESIQKISDSGIRHKMTQKLTRAITRQASYQLGSTAGGMGAYSTEPSLPLDTGLYK